MHLLEHLLVMLHLLIITDVTAIEGTLEGALLRVYSCLEMTSSYAQWHLEYFRHYWLILVQVTQTLHQDLEKEIRKIFQKR